MKKKIILFDLDGTLIDSTEAILFSFHQTFETLGIDNPSDEEIKNQIGHPLPKMFISLGVNEEEANKASEIYKSFYRKVHIQKTKLLPNVSDSIREAYSFARLGIVTTKTAQYSIELLESFGIYKYFETLIGGDNVIAHKPHPEPILKALSNMGVDNREKVYMVGDTCMDIEASINANVNPIGVEWGYSDREILEKCGAFVLKSVSEAVDYIKDL